MKKRICRQCGLNFLGRENFCPECQARGIMEESWRPLEFAPSYEMSSRGKVRHLETQQVKLPYAAGRSVGYRIRMADGRWRSLGFVRMFNSVWPEVRFRGGPEFALALRHDLLNKDTRVCVSCKQELPLVEFRDSSGHTLKSCADCRSRKNLAHMRKCHDCGRLTTDYRCPACWQRLRAEGGYPSEAMDYVVAEAGVMGNPYYTGEWQ